MSERQLDLEREDVINVRTYRLAVGEGDVVEPVGRCAVLFRMRCDVRSLHDSEEFHGFGTVDRTVPRQVKFTEFKIRIGTVSCNAERIIFILFTFAVSVEIIIRNTAVPVDIDKSRPLVRNKADERIIFNISGDRLADLACHGYVIDINRISFFDLEQEFRIIRFAIRLYRYIIDNVL